MTWRILGHKYLINKECGVRISTAATRRAIDRWKERIGSEASRFYLSTSALIASFLPAPEGGRSLFAFALIPATIANFALSEFALLALLFFLTAKLNCYRLANAVLKAMPFTR